MQLPNLTRDHIRQRCTAQSFTRGTEYFHDGAISNPVLHDWTLSATCHGTYPYRVSVELMPTGIAATRCSCPYDGEGECKHIVALLLTYIQTPDIICSIDALIATLSEKPKAQLLRIISELLSRTPDLASVARVYANMTEETGSETAPTAHELTVCAIVTTYRERIDRAFGPDFLEQHQLQKIITHLEGFVQHAKSLAHLGETELSLSILDALIHQSIVRYPDTLQRQELPRFVKKCATTFAQIAMNVEDSASIGSGIEIVHAPLREHYQMLLELSFEAEPIFISLLTRLLQQCCTIQESADLQATIEQCLDESPDRQAHVHLLFDFYFQAGRIGECLRLARRERENYLLIQTLFTLQQEAAAWQALETHPLSVDEYWCLLESPIATRIRGFTDKLLRIVSDSQPDTAIAVYDRLIEKTVLSRRREDYEKTRDYLMALRELYTQCDQENQWIPYLTHFRKRHARKRLLFQIIDAQHTI
ncbi:hypothetical protein F4X88_02250 [Candidatus Poribacteria bacterium]|nr:hypothetical protein [Candidatus Poribacteria bacterium]MYA55092.1 hypothetical protein [Candidatus Poribacteria bacterium]